MIKGVKYWNDRKTFSVQMNNGVENILRKWSGKPTGYLETCGPTAAVNVLDAMGVNTICRTEHGAIIQPEDYLTLWMNDPKNESILAPSRKDIKPGDFLCNEIPQYYEPALYAVFGVHCRYLDDSYKEVVPFDKFCVAVKAGHGALIVLKNPGHFLAVVAYDDETDELIYRDPWPKRTGTDGYNLRMGRQEYDTNVKPFVIMF